MVFTPCIFLCCFQFLQVAFIKSIKNYNINCLNNPEPVMPLECERESAVLDTASHGEETSGLGDTEN